MCKNLCFKVSFKYVRRECVPPSFTFVRHDSTWNAAVLSSHESCSRNFFIIYKNYPTFSSLCRFCRRTASAFFTVDVCLEAMDLRTPDFSGEERALLSKVTFDNNCGNECCLFRLQSDHCWLLEANSLDYRVLLEKATNQHQDSIQH